MKNAVGTATNVGTIDVNAGEKTSIHPAAYGVLMDMLSNIYSNASKAVLREYSCNGWDEHRKHGVERPVEVTLPSLLQPTLEIRDFGSAGLSADKVMEVFGEYGNSTKRDSDEEVGGFGIGSKAAFALGHQFIVTGYQDGRVFTALFTLNEDGTGTKTIMLEGETTEPNGVKVSLAVDDVDDMRQSAVEFFQFWDRGHVLVDGEEPTPIFESLERVNDEVFINPDGLGEAYAVMGPVAYPIDRALLRKVADNLQKQDMPEAADLPQRVLQSSTDLYLRVPIGSVKPAPSREALRDKPVTINTLSSVFLGLYQDSVTKVQNEVAQAPTYYDAVKRFEDANANLGAFKVSRKSVSWNGQPIRKVQMVGLENYRLVQRSWRSNSAKVLGIEATASAEFPEVEGWLTVTGVPEGQEGSVRRYSKRFLEDNEEGVTRIFVTSAEAVSFGWFQVGIERGARSVDLTTWKEMLKAIRKASPRTANEPSYSTGFGVRATRDLEDRDLLSDIISEGNDLVVFYESTQHLDRFDKQVLEGYTPIVLLATQSEAALAKRVEEDGSVKIVPWSTLKPQALALAQAVVDTLTDAEKEAMGARSWLAQNSHERQNIRNVVTALSLVGEVTSTTLAGAEESYALAEEFASGITKDRHDEVDYAYRCISRSLTDALVEYEDDTVDLSRLPLLDISDVNRAARDIRHNSLLNEETGERVFQPQRHWYSYSEENLKDNLLLLEHTLAYVNQF